MIHYCDIGDYLDRNEKLKIIAEANGLQGISWQTITPNEKQDWINQRGDVFDTFISLGAKRDNDTETIFVDYSRGIGTNRDAWQYGFSRQKMSANMMRMLEFYNELILKSAFAVKFFACRFHFCTSVSSYPPPASSIDQSPVVHST